MRNTFGLFATPLIITSYKCSDSIREFLNSQLVRETTNQKAEQFGRVSENTYILNNETCLGLSGFILQECLDFAQNVFGYDVNKMQFTQSWISIKYPGQSHFIHSHPNSIISGVYYFSEHDSPIEPIIFHKPYANFNNRLEVEFDAQKADQSQFAWTTFTMQPETDMLLLFPSHLQHSVGTNTTNEIRKSLAFNVIPTEFLGSSKRLTELALFA